MNKKTETKIFRTTLLITFASCIGIIISLSNDTNNKNADDAKTIVEVHKEAKLIN